MLLASGAMGVVGFAAQADETGPCENCADTMTIVSWGGAYQESQLKAYVQPYQEMHPEVKVSWDPSGAEAVAKLRAQNEAGNITWDLVDATGADNLRLCDEGLFREIDHDNELADGDDGSTATEDFGDGLVSDCYIPQIIYSTTFGYRTDMVPEGVEPPSNICDVFDLETYPGKRSLEKRPVNNMEWALMCSGVDKADIYDVLATPEGQEQALAQLDKIKDQTVWWSAGADTPQLLADGEIFIGSTYNGRLFSVIEEQKQPVAMMWDGQVFDYDGWGVPTGLAEDHLNRVMHFLRFATDTQRLADQASYISYGPGRASSAALVGKHAELGIDMAPHMPTDPANMTNVLQPNFTFWADYRDDIDAKFQAWLAN
jgi:putative spermidine/putrescine transport system substrate-binding protein